MIENSLKKQSESYSSKAYNLQPEELVLPVAPACNMMCNFCLKGKDCICNGNNPEYSSKCLTPRQAVNHASVKVNSNRNIKVLKISGPGEPLFNVQTYEVLRRIKTELPELASTVSTNGLLLAEKVEELTKLGVKTVEVCINAVFPYTAQKLYSRIIKGENIITYPSALFEVLFNNQMKGIGMCIQNGIEVKINTVYFPGINDEDIISAAVSCKELKVDSICLISSYPGGKLSGLHKPTLKDLIKMRDRLSRIVENVNLKGFVPSIGA